MQKGLQLPHESMQVPSPHGQGDCPSVLVKQQSSWQTSSQHAGWPSQSPMAQAGEARPRRNVTANRIAGRMAISTSEARDTLTLAKPPDVRQAAQFPAGAKPSTCKRAQTLLGCAPRPTAQATWK